MSILAPEATCRRGDTAVRAAQQVLPLLPSLLARPLLGAARRAGVEGVAAAGPGSLSGLKHNAGVAAAPPRGRPDAPDLKGRKHTISSSTSRKPASSCRPAGVTSAWWPTYQALDNWYSAMVATMQYAMTNLPERAEK